MTAATANRARRAHAAGNTARDYYAHWADVQAELCRMQKRDAVAFLYSLDETNSWSWYGRNLHRLRTMRPADLATVLTYADPTGEAAANRADAQTQEDHGQSPNIAVVSEIQPPCKE